MYTKLVTNNLIGAISRLSFRLFLLFLFVSVLKSVKAQLKYNFERINTETGLPTNAIKGLQFDETTRFLWVATESGIVRYNGHGFQSFGDNDKTSVLNGRIVFFDKTTNGKLFGKLIDERVFIIKDNYAVIENPIYIMSDENAYLDYKYNLKISAKNHQVFPIQLRDIKVGENVFVKYEYSLYKYFNNQLITIKDSLEFDNEFTINDRLYIVKKNGNIFKADIENSEISLTQLLETYKLTKTDPNNIFGKIKIFQNNAKAPVYLVSGEKIFLVTLDNNKLQLSLITDQLPKNEFIKYIQIDNITNTIFIGTDNRGLLVGRPQYFNRILPNNAIEGVSTSAYAQLQLNNGNIQINTGQIFGKSNINSSNVFYRPSETNTFISKDSFLYMSNSDGLVEFDLRKNRINNIANEINVSRNSLIQIGDFIYSFNEKGVAIKKTKWEYVLKLNNMPFNFIVYNLKQINDNEILAATTHGLYKYNIKQNTFTLFYNDKDNSNFRAIYNLNGYYLIGTYGGGVYMYYKDAIKKVPLDQNRYLNYTHCFIQDSKGNVWASTNKGLFMSPAQSLIDFWNKGPGNIKFKYFGKNEGIDQLEMNGGCNPCAIKLSNGNFSFPGIDGLIQFNPDSLPEMNIQPKVYIDKLLVDGRLINFDVFNNEFSSGVKNLEVQLGISGMLSQENIMLEYKFDNDQWVRLNVKNPIIKYSNPAYGNHTFSIRLRNTINDKWEQVQYPFSIKYPWTLNPFMYIVYLLLIVGMVLLYIRFKTIIYQQRQKILEKEVDAKTASLNSINETLLKRNQAKDHVIAIMNHDILTPLKYLHITAKNIAETTMDEKVKSSINQIARTSKDLEYLTSNMLNWVKFDNIESLPQKQSVDIFSLVNDLVDFVSPFKQNESLKIINLLPEDLIIQSWPDSLRVLLYNIIVNSINNTSQGQIIIGYSTLKNGYKIYVSDTGVGMNQSMIEYLLKGKSKDEVEQIPRYKKGNGVGFQIIRNIVQLMDAKLEIESKEAVGTIVYLIFEN
jgi:signal transduction histidine kinase